MSTILIIAEHEHGHLVASTARCLSAARQFGAERIDIAVFSDAPAAVAAEAAALEGVSRVLTIANPANAQMIAAVLAPQVVAIAADYSHILGPSTTFGKDLLPRVAALLGEAMVSDIMKVLDAYSFERPTYAGNAIVTISAGAGGTDAADWAQMLLKMYGRWCEEHDYGLELIDAQEADEAGLRSATFTVSGDYAFGYLKEENGVHRLVRISPFDPGSRRHTAFANVLVVPELDDEVEVEIDEKDLRVDTYRSGGAGGQHVNKTDSAVRLTHLPSGIVVQCQSERSQHKNRSKAMKVLRARLHEKMRLEQEERKAALAGEKVDVSFGSQIRSYTLHPQQRVKDHRTDVEIGNAMAVLDGELDELIRASLLQKASTRRPGASA